jgi:acyl-coenzyme A thioesterase PaaI-like protein
MRARWLRLGINLWPPYRGAGIRVEHISEDYRSVSVRMRLGLLNRNYIGTHFGGSLYAMTDPFYMLMLIHLLGRDYSVSHAGARIEFLAPARGTVHARFTLGDTELQAIRAATADGAKFRPEYAVDVKDAAGTTVARVQHQLQVRRRRAEARP